MIRNEVYGSLHNLFEDTLSCRERQRIGNKWKLQKRISYESNFCPLLVSLPSVLSVLKLHRRVAVCTSRTYAKLSQCIMATSRTVIWYLLSFFLSPISFYLTTLGLECYCCMWLHTLRQPQLCRTPLDEWSILLRGLYWQQHTIFTKDINVPGSVRTRNSRKREARGLNLRSRGDRDWCYPIQWS